MIKQVLATSQETFLLLRRDKIFTPIVAITFFIMFLSSFIAEWSVDDWRVTFFNLSATMLRFAGDMVAILFGTKLMQDASASGSIETSLSRPISRGLWVTGRYFGLAACLSVFAGISLGAWHLLNFVYEIGVPSRFLVWSSLLILTEWLVVGAAAIFFSTLGGFATALFASVSILILGLLIGTAASTFAYENSASQTPAKELVMFLSKFWNFDRFSMVNYSAEFKLPSSSFLIECLAYGVSWTVFLITGSCYTTYSKDIAH